MSTIALLAPYYTGSHAQWVDGLARLSAHRVRLFTLPGRFWKWRMHGGAISLAREFTASGFDADLILATDMVDLTTFLALTRGTTSGIPAAIYFHENQLTYPLPPHEKRDLHYGFINYTSMLAADWVFFNSAFHQEVFLNELSRLLKHFPDYNEVETVDQIRAKSSVLPLGLDLQRFTFYRPAARQEGPIRFVWNHRWEYDKKPGHAFDALYALQDANLPFEVSVLGKSFRQRPVEFLEAETRLAKNVVHFGYVESFEAYARHLWAADIQIGTAIQDFFGASTCEAITCDCLPILPNRLNYPAFIPDEHKDMCLYENRAGLIERLEWACKNTEKVRAISLAKHVARYDWQTMIHQYDRAFQSVVDGTISG
ncbi:MAG: DUF3524 domain-containing protein [Anaerolineae bacterium]|nr:DUF3524 domain-containing protein [Anaerolineae bacterium]